MCSKTIVGLLSITLLCWANPPMVWAQSPNLGQEKVADDSGGGAQAVVHAAAPNYKACDPHPPNGACGVTATTLSWTPGDTAVAHNVYLGTHPDLGPSDLMAVGVPYTTCALGLLLPGRTYYWRINEVEQNRAVVYTGDVWCFTTSPGTPCPDVTPWPGTVIYLCCGKIVLSWPADPKAVKYDVYLAQDVTAVQKFSRAAYQGPTAETMLPVEGLVAGVTYYWCANAVAADGTVQLGELWSFKTADFCNNEGVLREWWLRITGTSVHDADKYYGSKPDGQECLTCFEGPTNWADNYASCLSALLLPSQSGAYTFWIASSDQSELWLSSDANRANVMRIAAVTGSTAPRQWDLEPGQQSAPIMLKAGQQYFILALHKAGTGNDNIAVAWKGPGVPDRTVICVPYVTNPACGPLVASSPQPADGGPQLSSTPILSWQAGREALQHDVYLGADYESVLRACPCTSSVYRGRQSQTTYDPGGLAPGTYYWRINEVNVVNSASPWMGCVWSFTIEAACAVLIDNFESYNPLHPIQSTWTGTPLPVVLEQTIVHGGAQSIALDYDNRSAPYYSEAQPPLSLSTNWTRQGVTTLSLWFRGHPGNSVGSLYVRAEDSSGRLAFVINPDAQAVLTDTWMRWQIPFVQFTNVDFSRVQEVAIGVGRALPDGTGSIYIDDICLH